MWWSYCIPVPHTVQFRVKLPTVAELGNEKTGQPADTTVDTRLIYYYVTAIKGWF
jgi:hypothetical protein